MFDDNMDMDVRGSGAIPKMFQMWMAELSRDMLRLGVYFRALGIMLQIPGAPDYEWFSDADGEDQFETDMLFGSSNENTLSTVLAKSLERLGAGHLMEQMPDADYDAVELSDEWEAMLDRRERNKNGLLSLVADCLDLLIVEPGMAEIERAGEVSWWHRFVPDK